MSGRTDSSAARSLHVPTALQTARATLGVLAVVLAIANANRWLPAGLSNGVVLQGLVSGALTGLAALGLVVIYRANRMINFAQTALGLIAGVMAFHLMVVTGLPWLIAVPVSVAMSVGLSAAVEVTVIRRLKTAPRLIATVSTIGVTQVLAFLAITITALFDFYHYEAIESGGRAFPTPWGEVAFIVDGIAFTYDHVLVLVLVPTALAMLAWFFRRSLYGVAIRAAAQNADRAGLLGIQTPRLSTLAWSIAGGLSALAFVLQAPIFGFYSYGAAAVAGSLGVFVRALAAATVARMESLPLAFATAVGLGIVEQALFYNYGDASTMEPVLLATVLVALIVQRSKISRATWVETSTWEAMKEPHPVSPALLALPRIRVARGLALLVTVGLVAIAPVLLSIEHVRLLSVMGIYSLVGISLVLLSGWAGQVSLGQWAFVGIGAFVAGRVAIQFSPDLVVTVVLSGLAGAFVALLVGLPALRIRGLFLGATTVLLATTAAGWIFTRDAVALTGRLTRPTVLGFIEPTSERSWYLVVYVALFLMVAAVANIRRSNIGRSLIAIRNNETAAQAYGLNPSLVKLGAFAVSGFIAAAAGALYAYLQQVVTVSQFAPSNSLFVFAMVVIGGLGSVAGAVAGAMYVLGAQYFLPEAGGFLATGIGMLLLLLFMPGGLSQLLYAARDRALARIAGDTATKPHESSGASMRPAPHDENDDAQVVSA